MNVPSTMCSIAGNYRASCSCARLHPSKLQRHATLGTTCPIQKVLQHHNPTKYTCHITTEQRKEARAHGNHASVSHNHDEDGVSDIKSLEFVLSLVRDVRGGESMVGTRTTKYFSGTNSVVSLVVFPVITIHGTWSIVIMIWTTALTAVFFLLSTIKSSVTSR